MNFNKKVLSKWPVKVWVFVRSLCRNSNTHFNCALLSKDCFLLQKEARWNQIEISIKYMCNWKSFYISPDRSFVVVFIFLLFSHSKFHCSYLLRNESGLFICFEENGECVTRIFIFSPWIKLPARVAGKVLFQTMEKLDKLQSILHLLHDIVHWLSLSLSLKTGINCGKFLLIFFYIKMSFLR